MKVVVVMGVICEWLNNYEIGMPTRSLLSLLPKKKLIIGIALTFKNTVLLYGTLIAKGAHVFRTP